MAGDVPGPVGPPIGDFGMAIVGIPGTGMSAKIRGAQNTSKQQKEKAPARNRKARALYVSLLTERSSNRLSTAPTMTTPTRHDLSPLLPGTYVRFC